MILTKEVEVKVMKRNIKHFKKMGYDVKYLDIIKIPIKHLSKGSDAKIEIKCDICGEKKELKYKYYIKNIKKYNIYSCSPKCAQFKNKQTNLEKHGVAHISQIEGFYKRVKETKLKNHGDENYVNIKKHRQTNLEKHGVENYTNREKHRQTNLERHGVENYVNPEKISESWGNKSQEEIIEINNKNKQTKLKNHGDENYNNRKQFLETWENKSSEEKQEIFERTFQTKFGLTYEQYLEQLPAYKRYRSEVLKVTKKQPLNILKNYNKRGYYDYHIDHKFSISEGFKQNICPYIIGNIINLEMLTWKNNISKNSKCSILKKELFNLYDNEKNILKQLIEDYNKNII